MRPVFEKLQREVTCQTLLCVSVFALQAALDFLVEENLKARVSCWYVKNYIEDHPLQLYKDRVIT